MVEELSKIDLNHERAEEEKRGLIRWLRPDFQNPDGADRKTQKGLGLDDEKPTKKKPAKSTAAKIKKVPWPDTERDRIQLIREKLLQHGQPASVNQIARYFTRAHKATLEELLIWLTEIGMVRITETGEFVA